MQSVCNFLFVSSSHIIPGTATNLQNKRFLVLVKITPVDLAIAEQLRCCLPVLTNLLLVINLGWLEALGGPRRAGPCSYVATMGWVDGLQGHFSE